jgi:LacI family transcriptional regulator
VSPGERRAAAALADRAHPPSLLRDVAARAGVSPATVSRVLNGSAHVRPAKRDQVLAAIDEAGYRRNRIAANMRRQQVQMVGVVVPDVVDPYFAQMVRTIQDGAYLKGYLTLLCNTDEDPLKQREYLGALLAERVGGVIISPADAYAPEISELLDNGAPVVAVGRVVADPRADVVLAATVEGARLGTEHFIAGGHRRIGFIGGQPNTRTEAQFISGYQNAIVANELAALITRCGFGAEGGREAAAELINEGATALLVANSRTAVGALQYLKEARLRVPSEVALISLDDAPWAELTRPPLSSLARPARAMARTAVGLLLDRSQRNRKRGQRLVFEFELRHRCSCCIPTARRAGAHYQG